MWAERTHPDSGKLSASCYNRNVMISNGFRHSFTTMLCCALLVASLSACLKKDDPWNEKDRESSIHYYNSQRANREATRIIDRAGNQFSPKEKAAVQALTLQALREAEKVDNEFLDKVSPEFKKHFRGEFQVAVRLALRNLQSPDYEAAKESTVLFSNFVDWFDAHRDELIMPEVKN